MSDLQIAALLDTCRQLEYDDINFVQLVVEAFQALDVNLDELDAKGEGEVFKYARTLVNEINKMQYADLASAVQNVVQNGFSSLDFFVFAEQNGIDKFIIGEAKQTMLGANDHYIDSSDDEGVGNNNNKPGRGLILDDDDAKDSGMLSFASVFPHKYSFASRQCSDGLYKLKEIRTLLSRVSKKLNEFSKDLEEMCDSPFSDTQKQKMKKAEKKFKKREKFDAMETSSNAVQQINKTLRLLSYTHRELSENIMKEVVEPLKDFEKIGYKRFDELKTSQAVHEAEISKVKDGLYREKTECVQLVDQLRLLQDKQQEAKEQTKEGGLFSRLGKKLKTSTKQKFGDAQLKTHKTCVHYTSSILKGNNVHERYQDIEMPKLLVDLQNLEVARLETVNNNVSKFSDVMINFVNAMAGVSEEMTQQSKNVSIENDFQKFLYAFLQKYGEPTPSRPFLYDISCTPNDILKGFLEVYKGKNTIFNSSLSNIMKRQHDEYPNEELPKILTILTKCVKTQNGYETQDIFKKKIEPNVLAPFRQEFELGEYEIKNTDPHISANLLTLWLASLPEPLIATSLFQKCVDCSKAQAEGKVSQQELKEQIQDIVAQNPKINQKVLKHLLGVLKDLCHPNYAPLNGMDSRSLSVLFSPYVIKRPQRAKQNLKNKRHETNFVGLLIAHL